MAKKYLKDTILDVTGETVLDGKILVVDTKRQAYPRVDQGAHSYQIVKTGSDYAIYPQLVKADHSGLENAKEPVVFTDNNVIFFNVRRESAPYFDLISRREPLGSGQVLEQQVLQAFIAYVRSHFSMGKSYILLTDDEYYAPVAATGITLDKETASLNVAETVQLVATLAPASSDSDVTWESSNPAVATVTGEGLVTGVADGTANIVAKADGVTATCVVTVPKA